MRAKANRIFLGIPAHAFWPGRSIANILETDGVLCDLSFVFVYLDDTLVASLSADEHLVHLKHTA